MKSKALFSVVLAVAITAATASVVGCSSNGGNGKPIAEAKDPVNIGDYAVDIRSDAEAGFTPNWITTSKKSVSALTKLISTDSENVVSNSGNILITTSTKNDKIVYDVYNVAKGKKILSELTVKPTLTTLGELSVIIVYYSKPVTSGSYGMYIYQIFNRDDGSILLDKNTYADVPTVTTHTYYVGGSEKTSTVYKLTANDFYNPLNATTVYFERKIDEDSGKVTYVKVNESDLDIFGGEHKAGSTLKTRFKVADTGFYEKKYVSGDLLKAEFERVGDNVNCYYDGNLTYTLDTTNCTVVGAVGNNIYFNSIEYLDKYAQSGYNVYKENDGEVSKCKYTLTSVDFTNGKTKTYDYNFIVGSVLPAYNHTAKKYDAAIVFGYERNGGVGRPESKRVTYIVNENFELCYDITDYVTAGYEDIYKLSENRYLIGRYVVNEKLEYVNYIQSGNFNCDEQIYAFTDSSYTGFANLNNKVVIEPRYKSVSSSFGGYFYAREYSITGEMREVILSKGGSKNYLDTYIVDKDNDSVTVNTRLGVYVVKRAVYKNAAIASYTYTLYAFNGAVLHSYNTLYYSSDPIFVDNSLCYTARTKNETTGVESNIYSVYKLS